MQDFLGFSTTMEVCNSLVMLKISDLLLLVLRSIENDGFAVLFFLIFSSCLTEWPSLVKASELSELSVD